MGQKSSRMASKERKTQSVGLLQDEVTAWLRSRERNESRWRRTELFSANLGGAKQPGNHASNQDSGCLSTDIMSMMILQTLHTWALILITIIPNYIRPTAEQASSQNERAHPIELFLTRAIELLRRLERISARCFHSQFVNARGKCQL